MYACMLGWTKDTAAMETNMQMRLISIYFATIVSVYVMLLPNLLQFEASCCKRAPHIHTIATDLFGYKRC